METKTSNLKRIIPLVLVVSTLCFVMLFNDSIVKPSYASLVTYTDTTLSSANNQCAKMQGASITVCIPNEDASSSHKLSYFSSNIVNPIIHTITIKPQLGGCGDISNACSSNGGSVSCDNCHYDLSGHSGKLGGLWCGITECYTWWITSDSYSNQLLRITINGASQVTGYMNVSSSTKILPSIWGLEITHGGYSGNSIFTVRCTSSCASNTGTLYKTGGTFGQMSDVGSIDTSQFFTGDSTTAQGWGITNIDGCWFCNGSTDISNANNKLVVIASKQGATTNRAITVIHADTMLSLCGATNTGASFTTGQHTGIIRFYNSTRWLYATDANIYLVGLTDCGKKTTTAYSTLGLVNYVEDVRTIKDFANNNTGSTFWIQHGSTSGLASLTQVNMTTFNTTVNFDTITGDTISGYIHGNNLVNSLVVDNTSHELVRTDSSSRLEILYLPNFQAGEEEHTGGFGGGGGSNTLGRCDANTTAIQCAGDRSEINRITGGPNIGNVTYSLLSGIGIVSTDNPDIQTNGTGLMLMMGLGTFFASAIIGSIAIANQRFGASIQFTAIPKEMWLFLVIGVVGASFYLGWIPNVIFYAMIVGLAGLLALGGYNRFAKSED